MVTKFERYNEGFRDIKTWADKKINPGDYGSTMLDYT
jgi:hypothetical protein